ncbi:hypothetical protein [Lentiprolixibacter aurantiacus]|uniref:Lipoprotein n=1 Tax=Lentiprolixibacter aurantiacus TaxID=2993939 RepID=A0AAE3ML57_9FLAO|nr:hypothetical protein [Lentiprolixibacter aurantiacus]MCX2719413.1 hypothetical protein [Lentiprolixibacter aurantiacus]
MSRNMAALFSLICILGLSCRKDFDFERSQGQLLFSKDTVFLDTVFTGISSSTYTLKVYNPTDSDLRIPFVGLLDGENSGYRLNVDGLPGKEFENVPILARDSLYVFIETTLDISDFNQNQFLYTDILRFGSGNSSQDVPLVTLIRDAVFLYPATLADGSKETISIGLNPDGSDISVQGFYLQPQQLNFTSDKPYVVYGYAAVPVGETLNMAAGSRVHFHKESGLWVGPGASLEVNGALSTDPIGLENEVIFEGDRLEPEFSDVPGQWGSIWLAPGSVNNTVSHLTIKNATVGLLAEGGAEATPPTLEISNTQIYNSALVNLWGRNSSINGKNLVSGNAGNASFYVDLGGNYRFVHATFANYWSNGPGTGAAVQLNNFQENSSTASGADLSRAFFGNCIVAGNTSNELFFNNNGVNTFNFNFDHCIIQFGSNTEDPLYDFQDTSRYINIQLNGDPAFLNIVNQDFRLSQDSDAIGNANPFLAQEVILDLSGNDRSVQPDIGAWQYLPDE